MNDPQNNDGPGSKTGTEYPLAPLKTLLWRGWRKKCPRCGEGPVFRRWLMLYDQCPHCGLVYLENQGDLLGPMMLVDRVIFLIPLVTIFYFCFPHAPMWFFIPGAGLLLFLLVFTMPNRNGVFLAFDYYLRDHPEISEGNAPIQPASNADSKARRPSAN